MSEPAGRYQSRILSFVSRQTQKLADKASTLLRQLKVTTIWTTQIILYPAYALWQTARLVGRQLRQAGQKLPPIAASQRSKWQADEPVVQVLDAIVRAGVLSQPARTHPTALPTSAAIVPTVSQLQLPLPALQGLACLIEQRRLVLVTADQQLLDILTPDQQQLVQRQIILAIANYWYARRRVIAPVPLPVPRDQPTALPPIRIFSQLMAWLQTGPIATTANLFQEAAIAPTADWFDWQLTSSPAPLTRSWPSVPVLNGRPPALLPTPIALPSLIRAALRYFFGDRFPLLSSPAPANAAGRRSARSANLLPLIGLAGADKSGESAIVVPKTIGPQPASPARALPTRFSWGQVFRRGLPPAQRPIAPPVAGAPLSAFLPFDHIAALVGAENLEGEIVPAVPRPQDVAAPAAIADWIEIPATSAGYVKHPLTQVIGWVDGTLLWLERRLIALWQRLGRLLR